MVIGSGRDSGAGEHVPPLRDHRSSAAARPRRCAGDSPTGGLETSAEALAQLAQTYPTPPHPTPPRIHPRRGGRQRKPWDKRGLGDVVDGIGVGEASGCVAAGKIAHLIADIEAQSPSVASPLGRPRRLELSRAERLLRCGAQRER